MYTFKDLYLADRRKLNLDYIDLNIRMYRRSLRIWSVALIIIQCVLVALFLVAILYKSFVFLLVLLCGLGVYKVQSALYTPQKERTGYKLGDTFCVVDGSTNTLYFSLAKRFKKIQLKDITVQKLYVVPSKNRYIVYIFDKKNEQTEILYLTIRGWRVFCQIINI